MDFWVKDENGKLVKATRDQILDPMCVLYDSEGKLLNRKSTHKDPVVELEGIVKDIALRVGTLADIQEKQEKMDAQIKAFEEAQKRGISFGRQEDNGTPVGYSEDGKKFFGFDMAYQGKRLMDKLTHPSHQMDKETHKEVAEYFILFAKAALFGEPAAIREFRSRYSRKTGTTQLGDTGNVFPVPDIVDSEILAFARESSLALRYCRIWPMTSEKQSFPLELTGVAVGWGNTTSESDPTASEVELTAQELSAYSGIRNTTIADARSDVVSWLTELMAEAAGLEIDNQAFNGTGDPCSGILTAACGYSVTMGAGSTAFSMITGTVLSEMIGKLDGQKKQGARFFLHGSVLHFVRDLKDANGRPIFVETLGSPVSGTIWGYPYSESIKHPSTSGAATAFLSFGNLRFFCIGRRLDSTSLQVDPYGLWTTNRTRFKIYQRWGLGIGLANGLVRLLTHA